MKRHHGLQAVILLCFGCFITGALPAAATEKGYDAETAEKTVGGAVALALTATVSEIEPNDTCPGQAVLCGDVITANLSPAGDVDLFSFSADAGSCLALVTGWVAGQNVDTDTRIELLNGDCSAVLASDDDSGPGLFSWIANFPAPYSGNYMVRVRHLSDTGTGTYELTVSCNPTAPQNSTCAGATVIGCGNFNDAGATFCAGNDLNLPSGGASCTGFTSAGQDVVYSVSAGAGAVLTANFVNDGDASIYILTSCDNAGSCVAGSDVVLAGSQETLTYTFLTDGTYFLVLDTFGTGSAGHFSLSVNLDCVGVPVQTTTWGAVKARFIDE